MLNYWLLTKNGMQFSVLMSS